MNNPDIADIVQYNKYVPDMKVSRKRRKRNKVEIEIPTYVMNITNRKPIYVPIRRQPVSFQLYSPGTEPNVGAGLTIDINPEKQSPERRKMRSKEKPIEVIVISDDEDSPLDEEDLYLPTVRVTKLDMNHLKYLSRIHTIRNYSEIFQELFDCERVNIIKQNMKNFRTIKKIRQTQNSIPDIRSSTLKVDLYQKFMHDNYAREQKFKRNTTFMFTYYAKNNKQMKKPLSSVELLSQSEEHHDLQPRINTLTQSNYPSPEANLYQPPKTDYFYPKPYMNLIPPVINQQPESILYPQPSISNTNPEPSTSSSTMLDTDSESEIKPRAPPKKRRPKNDKQKAALLSLAKSLIENTNTNLSACMLTPPNSISGDNQLIENFEDGNSALLRNSIPLSTSSHNFVDSYGPEYLMPSTSWMYGGYSPYGAFTYNIPQ